MRTLFELPDFAINIFKLIYGIFVGFGFYNVVMGVFHLIVHADDEEERAKSRGTILWGIISLFLLLSIWGLVNILRNTYTLDDAAPGIPQLGTQGGSTGGGFHGLGNTCDPEDPFCEN